MINTILHTLFLGLGATLTMDFYALTLKLFGIKSLDYRFVGRWIGHFPKGKFFHSKITEASPVPYEQVLGWVAHYSIGIAFAFLLVVTHGKGWLSKPTLFPALAIGIITIVAPFFLMQPAFGLGFAGSNLPNPDSARLMSLVTHCIFGVGLYLSALLINQIIKSG